VSGLLVRAVALGPDPGDRVDLRCDGGMVTDVAADLVPRRGETVVVGATTALPGLHDHHLHLLAMAARITSVDLGAPAVTDPAGLDRALRDADRRLRPGVWIRAVGHDESTGGPLDRHRLDRLVAGRPVRVQDRSGHAWTLNSAAGDLVGLHCGPPGTELDDRGRPTGRLVDGDGWLADRLPAAPAPDLAPVGRRLSSLGVTGVTDATPTTTTAALGSLADARQSGALRQQVTVMGEVESGADTPEGLLLGPVKVMVADGSPPTVEALAARFADAHRGGRPVAVHCVTRIAAVLAVAAWEDAGVRTGDRMEHGGVVPPELIGRLAALGITVVTQPAFVLERGDRYLTEVEGDDRPHLYPCAGLLSAGVPVGGSTDAPFGPDDPWVAMGAAVSRRARSGTVVGGGQAVAPARALRLFLSGPDAPGGPARRLRTGVRADLCLLDCTLDVALRDLEARHVVATVAGGRLVHEG